MTVATIETTEHSTAARAAFRSFDGTELFYRAWEPAVPSGKALILFHRGHEHSGRFEEFVRELGLEDFRAFAWDARGHGQSPGERGYAESFSAVVRDVDCFVRFICEQYQLAMENVVVLGHSVGAVAVAAWVHDYAPPIRGMVLATPALRVKLYVPLALPALRTRMLLGGRSTIKSYVRPRMLTHDAGQAELYRDDPLISRNIATNILLDLHDASTRLMADAGAITTPAMVLSAGSDWVVRNSAQRTFFDRLSSPRKVLKEYPGFYHAILHERERHGPIADVRDFVNGLFDDPPERTVLLDADRTGYTHGEYEGLKRPLPAWSPKRWSFAAQRLGMKTACRLGDGARLGWRTGFDSGESLDYVYRDRAKGITPLGRLIDRTYLNTIGWRGIRVRKANLQELLRLTIGRTIDSGQPARVVDIAAGAGRYTLEVLREFRGRDVSALLRDRSPSALEAARKSAAEMGVNGVGFAEGDAFSRDSLAQLAPRPNIAIVSGLYELFDDNGMVGRSLRGLADALPEGGHLIYTNQPWHPQLEMIARTLVNREQKPWVMRRRTQAEMDELARAAGFEKIDMRIDRWGIFTVSLARRVGP